MSGFLLDTNVISEAVKVLPEPRVLRWLGAMEERLLFVSVLSLGEIRKGIAGLAHSRKRTELENWLEGELRPRFAGRILTVDQPVADRWGALAAEAKGKGRTISVIDSLLAATALQHNLTIISRNVADFSDIYAQVLNPWVA